MTSVKNPIAETKEITAPKTDTISNDFLTVNDIVKMTSETMDRMRKYHETTLLNIDIKYMLPHLVNAVNYFYTMHNQLRFWKYVSSDPAVRDASIQADITLTQYMVEFESNKVLYGRIFEYYKQFKNALDPLTRRFMRKILKTCERSGVLLSSDDLRQKLMEIEKTIIELESQFSKNISDSNTQLQLSEKDIVGMPTTYLKILQKVPEGYTILMNKSNYTLCMRYLTNADVRKKIEIAYNTKCLNDNGSLLVELTLLRHKRAKLLGYENHAEYATDILISRNPDVVQKFLSDIHVQIDNMYYEEMVALLKLKKASNNVTGTTAVIDSWDVEYYFNQLEKTVVGIDMYTKLETHFTLSQVEKVLFELCEKIFNLKFAPAEKSAVWNNDVQVFNVFDVASGSHLGLVYMDLFDRPGKTQKNNCFCIMPYAEFFGEHMESKHKQLPAVTVVMNILKRSATPDEISFISHEDMLEFFQEIGRAIHMLCGQLKYTSLAGCNVEKDFSEVTPKIMEQLAWNKLVLSKLKFSDTEITNLIRKKNISNGISYKNQILLSRFDILIHTRSTFLRQLNRLYLSDSKKAVGFLKKVYSIVHEDILRSLKVKDLQFTIRHLQNTFLPSQWLHLAEGYDSRFYSYMWSDVFAMDIYCNRFSKQPLSAINIRSGFTADSALILAGKEYREKILNQGGSVKAVQMAVDVLQRLPSTDSFFDNKVYKIRGHLENEDYMTENSEILHKSKLFLSTKSDQAD